MASARLFVGTSGFAFEGWRGPFYPEDLKPKQYLSHYAGRLSSVEINYTFRRFPSTSTLEGWIAQSPDDFAFSVKVHQRITHTSRLKEPAEAVDFVARVGHLGSRLGPVLFQCPPNLKLDAERLWRLLDALPTAYRYAFEFRNPSWATVSDELRERGAAVCVSETDAEPSPDEPLDSGAFVYLRLRKEGYSEAELVAWTARVREALARGTTVYCYFKHEDHGIGPRLAESLAARVAELG